MLHQATVLNNNLGDDTLRIQVKVPAIYGESVVVAWPLLLPRHCVCVSPDGPCTCSCHQTAPAIGSTVWVTTAGDGSVVWLGLHSPPSASASALVGDPYPEA